ncbi:MAG: aspartate kinase, partial [Shewanella sp.]
MSIDKLVVAKFGGTSLANSDALTLSAKIILNDASRRVVVVSAAAGVTNLLVELTTVTDDEQRFKLLKDIAAIQYKILDALHRPNDVAATIDGLLSRIAVLSERLLIDSTKALKDELLACGELCSSQLFAATLRELGVNAISFDVRQILRTDSHFGRAEPQIDMIAQLAQLHLAPLFDKQVVVTQGFIGSDDHGMTTTLGRGGSDYSAALLAEALGANAVEIWTDVAGIYTTDPRLAANAKPLAEISFNEAAEMATFGAKVLHPATILPAVRRGIEVFVGSSREPERGGTWIRNRIDNPPLYRAI